MAVIDLLEQAWETGRQTVDGWTASMEATARAALSRGVATVLDLVDLEAIAQRLPIDAILQQIDLNAVLGRIDLDAVLQRVDLAAMVDDVLTNIDIGGLIRQSTESVTSDAVHAGRAQAMAMDSAITSVADRLLHRRARVPRATPVITGGAT